MIKVLQNIFCMAVAVSLFAQEGGIPIDCVEYFDVGKWEASHFIDASKGTLNVDGLDNYLYMFFQDMWGETLGTANFCYAQVQDIALLAKENYAEMSPTNDLSLLYKKTKGLQASGMSIFSYMVDRLITMGDMNLGLTFGGKHATAKDWDFGFDEKDPVAIAKGLADWANSLKLQQIDFNVMNSAFAENDPEKMALFFITLKAHFSGFVTLTVPAAQSLWGFDGECFSALFKQEAFQNMFDTLNLMLFDKNKYYLNAGQDPLQNWDLYAWLKQLVENSSYTYTEAAACLNIGFNAGVDYLDEKSSAGPLPYDKMPEGITNGNATKFIFLELEKALQALTNEDISLGNPFYMDDNADYSVSSSDDFDSEFFNNTGNLELDFKRYP